ncbi:hypothetical protein BZZ01_25935 [Nostocales cyanobacterium HT-58-2]|nr:hypothetical protein BZZ01_25935 [Nostocales cyanobacterium HT-58-2]
MWTSKNASKGKEHKTHNAKVQNNSRGRGAEAPSFPRQAASKPLSLKSPNLFLTHTCSSQLFTKKTKMLYYSKLSVKNILKLVRSSGCTVALNRVNIYCPLQKILKYIAQNLPHGSIF